ncbi:MAG TPA: acyl-CoA dehydrogenase family protein [Nannocystis sp.]|jgi:acyl-CoA dehydrogenase
MSNSILTPRILDRALGTVVGDLAIWRALEDSLEAFTTRLRGEPVDEADEAGATRIYVQKLAEAGLLRWMVPAGAGGAAEKLSSTAICLIRQWLARESGALDNAFVMQGLGSNPVTMAGPAALREKLLPRVARGAAICAFALTEPEAGSDIKNMRTTATPDGDGVRLRGGKCFISNAGVADSYVVFAREADSPPERPRFGAFWLPGDAPGLTVTPTKVIAPHPIGVVDLADVRVPAEHRIGAYGDGLKIALANLEVFRVTVGAAALGLADRALSETVAHLKTRVQFGQPLATQQGLQFALADVATDHVAAQLLVYRAAGARDEGRSAPEMAGMAKMFATESAQRTIDRAVQSFGGRGVTVGEVPERLYREIRALRIYEGTTEVQKLVIARALLGA